MTTLYSRLSRASAWSALLALVLAGEGSPEGIEIESGSVSFEAVTNMPGIEVKGTSTSLSAMCN